MRKVAFGIVTAAALIIGTAGLNAHPNSLAGSGERGTDVGWTVPTQMLAGSGERGTDVGWTTPTNVPLLMFAGSGERTTDVG